MPNATVRANARTMPDATRLRAKLAAAADRIIAALDALDAPEEDLEDGHDLEDDPAELGIADHDGYHEQLTGEPSLGATLDIDQVVAWGDDRLSMPLDGEATGTEDDIASWTPTEAWQESRRAAQGAREQLRGIVARRRAAAVEGRTAR